MLGSAFFVIVSYVTALANFPQPPDHPPLPPVSRLLIGNPNLVISFFLFLLLSSFIVPYFIEADTEKRSHITNSCFILVGLIFIIVYVLGIGLPFVDASGLMKN